MFKLQTECMGLVNDDLNEIGEIANMLSPIPFRNIPLMREKDKGKRNKEQYHHQMWDGRD
jgi:hypothetical protein